MANMKRGELGYQPYQGQSVLAGGMLAVDRPGGEVEHALSQAMFGAANVFGQQAESNAIFKGNGDAPSNFDTKVTVSGGDKATIAAPNAGAPAGVNSHMGNGTVRSIIANAAGKYGQSPSLMLKFANIESGMNPNAKNKNSSAGGLFQQTDGNAAQYGVADRFDAAQSADGAARFLRDNGNHLRKVLGRDPTEGELYLAHQQGGGGAAALLKNPNASAVSVVGLKAVIQNGGNANMSAGQFASLWTHKFGDAPVGEGIGPLIINQAPAAASTTTDPTIRTPLDIQSTGEGLQTTGRNTLYGSAYDAAATSVDSFVVITVEVVPVLPIKNFVMVHAY